MHTVEIYPEMEIEASFQAFIWIITLSLGVGVSGGKQGKAGGGVQIIHMHNITEENVTLRCIQGQFGGLK